MPPFISCHTTALPDGAQAPEWVHLLPAGSFRGSDGRGPYTADMAAVIAASGVDANPLVIDESHSTDHSLTSGQPAPGMGWIDQLQARDDGLWGHVRWTPPGIQLMADKAYRFLSPVFQHAQDGRVLKLLRAALTNAPNLTLTSLHSTGAAMDLLARLRQALGLPDTADEAAVLTAVTAAHTAQAAHAQQLGRIAVAAGVAADAKPEAIVTALQTVAATASDATRMATEMVSLQTQVTTLRTERAREVATAAIDAALRAGKPIPASIREHYIARHMTDPAGVQKELDAMPSLQTGGLTPQQLASPAVDGLSATEAVTVRMMGITPEMLKAGRDAREATRLSRGGV